MIISLFLVSTGDGEKSFTHPLSEKSLLLDLDRETNSRRLGVFVYRVDQTEIIEPAAGEREIVGREGGREGGREKGRVGERVGGVRGSKGRERERQRRKRGGGGGEKGRGRGEEGRGG